MSDVPGLAGYVTVTTPAYGNQTVDPSESDTLGSMFLQIPGIGSRDLEDAAIEKHGAEDWIWWGSTLTVTLPVGAQAHGQQRTSTPYPQHVARLR